MYVFSRLEVYLGKQTTVQNQTEVDSRTGPAAVLRNVKGFFCAQPYEGLRTIITDRYYTSVRLAQELRGLGYNFVGTIMQNRLGWCKALDYGSKRRPAHIPKGDFRMAQSKTNPQMIAIAWVDTKPVYFLSNGLSTEPTPVGRRDKKSGEKVAVPAFECIQYVFLTS
jgi:hypothetical protein